MAGSAQRLRREVLGLLLAVVVVDGLFLATYYAAGLAGSSAGLKLGFTILWTLATLAVVIRGVARVRGARGG